MTVRILLEPGHGAGDPGAVDLRTGAQEGKVNNIVTARTVDVLVRRGVRPLPVVDQGLKPGIVRANEFGGLVFAVEVHVDAHHLHPTGGTVASHRIGIYYHPDIPNSRIRAELFVAVMRPMLARYGVICWARPDTASRFGRLGWIRDVKHPSHIIECGNITLPFSDGYINDFVELLAVWLMHSECAIAMAYKGIKP